MSGRLDGKTAFITGVARGQGRSHAIRLAEEGANIVGLDIAGPVETMPYEMGTPADLATTVDKVQAIGRRMIAAEVDVRDYDEVSALVMRGIATFGGLDVVVANAAVAYRGQPIWEVSELEWDTVIDVNLKGVWHTVKAAVPHMIERGIGGSIVLVSSGAAIKGAANIGEYVAAKSGVIGLGRTLARSLGPHSIRVNTVCPGTTHTPMVDAEYTYRLFRPDLEAPTLADIMPLLYSASLLPVPWVEPVDISNAVLWLASDEARYVTGTEVRVDAGATLK